MVKFPTDRWYMRVLALMTQVDQIGKLRRMAESLDISNEKHRREAGEHVREKW